MDAFLPQALRAGETLSHETVYLGWLDARLHSAAKINRGTTSLGIFRRTRVQRAGRDIEGPDTVFHRTLSVLDSAGFAHLLARGVRHHRAYDYGMLPLRPPQRRV